MTEQVNPEWWPFPDDEPDDDEPRHAAWFIRLDDGTEQHIACWPPMSRAEVMDAQKTPTEGTEGLILIDVIARAHDTSYIDNPSVRSVPNELADLVRAVAREYGLDQAELREALDAAARDPANAWLSYRALARELGIEWANT